MIFLNSTYVASFCPPGPGSGFRMRFGSGSKDLIDSGSNTDPDRNTGSYGTGSGSATLVIYKNCVQGNLGRLGCWWACLQIWKSHQALCHLFEKRTVLQRRQLLKKGNAKGKVLFFEGNCLLFWCVRQKIIYYTTLFWTFSVNL
jgi:hypothetical protein